MNFVATDIETAAAKQWSILGADIHISITKRTNFVITGSAHGPSKMKKIEQFTAQGFEIRLVFEEEFLRMCKQIQK